MTRGEDILEAVKTLWGEARGERFEAKVAVFHVLLERQAQARAYRQRPGRNHPLFGDGTLTGVCLTPYRFSCRNQGDPDAQKIAALKLPDTLGDHLGGYRLDDLPALDYAGLSTVLMGMLGLGGLGTFEKIKGVAR